MLNDEGEEKITIKNPFTSSGMKSPFLTSVNKAAYDTDMRAACWRFISRSKSVWDLKSREGEGYKEFSKGGIDIAPALLKIYETLAEKVVVAKREEVSNLSKVESSYTDWFLADPYIEVDKGTSSKGFMEEARSMKRQIRYEADRWGLDLNTLKGCYLYYATSGSLKDPQAIKIFSRKVLGYYGRPIPPPGHVGVYASKNYTRHGGRKRYRRRKRYRY
jgi:hypothetical protein